MRSATVNMRSRTDGTDAAGLRARVAAPAFGVVDFKAGDRRKLDSILAIWEKRKVNSRLFNVKLAQCRSDKTYGRRT
jgi:hypothetical protein